MNEMESNDQNISCFICCNKILNPKDCSFQDTVDVNVFVIFILRNLLEIPKSLCENLLSRRGSPSGWILCCPYCVTLTRKAQKTFLELMELEKKFNELKIKVRGTALHQWRSFNEIDKQKNDTSDEIIRNAFLSHHNLHPGSKDNESSEIILKLDPDDCVTTAIKQNDDYFDDDTFDDTENSLNDPFFWDAEEDKKNENSHVQDNPSSQSKLRKRKVNNSSGVIKKRKNKRQPANDNRGNANPEDPYVCNESDCGQRFSYIHLVELHKRKYHVNKCDRCKTSFKTRKAFSAHRNQDDCRIQEFPDINFNPNAASEDASEDTKLSLDNSINVFVKDASSSHHSDWVTHNLTEDKSDFKETLMQTKSGKSLRSKRIKKNVNYRLKKADSDSDYSPEEDSESDYEKEASEHGSSSDADICDSGVSSTKPKNVHQTEGYIPKSMKNLMSFTSELDFKCSDCTVSFKYSHLLLLHRHEAHKIEIQCEQCDSKFKTKIAWKKHCISSHLEKKYPGAKMRIRVPLSTNCRLCGELMHPGGIKIHMQKHEPLSCEICNIPFVKIHKLLRHRRKYHYKEYNLEPFKCPECDKTFGEQSELDQHLICRHTKEYTLNCPICNAGITRANLKGHIRRMHSDETPFVCSFCGKGFKSKHDLEYHEISKHTKNYKFNCEICGKQFAKKYGLEKHSVLHQSQPETFVCELCGASFTQKLRLQYHQRGKHYKELNLEPYQCTECGIIFEGLESLRYHNITVHTEDPKKHSCSDCGKKYMNESSLKDHIRRHHTGEKIFECSSCDKRFFAKKPLERHIQRYHTKDFSFTCSLCPLGYTDSWGLTRHVKTVHGQN